MCDLKPPNSQKKTWGVRSLTLVLIIFIVVSAVVLTVKAKGTEEENNRKN